MKTGELFYNFQKLNGYLFLDYYYNLYDINRKRIYIGTSEKFIGDLEEGKEAFALFENFYLMEQKIKEGINNMNKESDKNIKSKIENEIAENLKKELEKYDFKNMKIKNGKYYIGTRLAFNIHDKIKEKYYPTKRSSKGGFIQSNIIEWDDWCKERRAYIKFLFHGKIKFYGEDGQEDSEGE